jgi:hypothetical protein
MTTRMAYEQLLEKLRPTLEELDAMRQSAFLNIFITTGGFSVIWIPIWFLVGGIHIGKDSISLLIAPIAAVASMSSWFFTRDLRKQFKAHVIRQFIKLIDPSFLYQPDSCIHSSDYKYSGIFQKAYDSYRGDDYVCGQIGDTNLAFSEIETSYKTGSGNSRRTVTIFHGLFAIADFQKNFTGSTYVLPDEAEANLGWIGQQLQGMNTSHGELIKLEDPEFEKLFVVYGDDQIESRYILSTSLMQRITRFRQKANVKVSIAFRGSKLYVAIHRNRDLFEPSLLTSYLKEGALDCYMEDLELIMGMVDDLNLNVNIWQYTQRKAV